MQRKSFPILLLLILLLGITLTTAAAPLAAPPLAAMPIDGGETVSPIRLWLTVLHNNDGESQLINAGPGLEDFGGAAAFKTVVDNLRAGVDAAAKRSNNVAHAVVMISSGDNFLAGPEFAVSLQRGVPFYDTVAMDLIDYDVVTLGNHDFDFGPGVLAKFLAGYTNPPPWHVAANLDFSGEPALQAFASTGVIRANIILRERGFRIGVIGVTTPSLPFSSSPGNVIVGQDLVTPIMTAVGRMQQRGVNIIILSSHLQDIRNEIELVRQLSDIDIVIAGGGGELLANPTNTLIPGDSAILPYPTYATDSTGQRVPIVTTSGDYRYVGKLVAGFDANGDLRFLDKTHSGPVRVATGDCNGQHPCDDAVVPDPGMMANVVLPVRAGLTAMASDIIAQSDVMLNGRSDTVRSEESNLGNLLADALLWQGQQDAAEFGAVPPVVALQNAGGIRNDALLAAGEISTLDTLDIAPFPNFLAVVEPIPRLQFKEILENAVACTQNRDTANPNCSTGRFAQIGGFRFSWSAAGNPLILDLDGRVVQPGTRIQSVTLDDGTVIVEDGRVLSGPPIAIVTNDFSARGGDQYPFRDAAYTLLTTTYQQALHAYIVDELGGEITTASYPEGGDGRIVPLP